jgi:hypothetical protein
MKKCTLCEIEKDLTCFVKQSKCNDGYAYWCKDCCKQYMYNRYHKDLEKSREQTNKRRAERVKWFRDLKSNIPCADCGMIYEPCCMDYDHVPEKGLKHKVVSKMVLDNTPINKILEEIDKCDLVCLLCHNKRTSDRFDEKLGKERKYKKNTQRNINIINKFKNNACVICKNKYELCNMQVDHIDPSTKLYDVCQLKNHKTETLILELAKCQVICAMCHRLKSIKEQNYGLYNVNREKPLVIVIKEFFYDGHNKECSICSEIKDVSMYYKQVKSKYGLTTACRDCLNKNKRNKRIINKKTQLLLNNEKRCTKCKEIISINDFSRRSDGGLFSWCKKCFNAYRRDRRNKVK